MQPHSTRSTAADEPAIAQVLNYATELAEQDLRRRASILIWPLVDHRKSPPYWMEFCARWAEWFNVPRELSPSAAAAVLHVITKATSTDERGELVTFVGYTTIAERAHVARPPVPLICAGRADRTKGIAHSTLRFTLIRDPLTFAPDRGTSRRLAEGLTPTEPVERVEPVQ